MTSKSDTPNPNQAGGTPVEQKTVVANPVVGTANPVVGRARVDGAPNGSNPVGLLRSDKDGFHTAELFAGHPLPPNTVSKLYIHRAAEPAFGASVRQDAVAWVTECEGVCLLYKCRTDAEYMAGYLICGARVRPLVYGDVIANLPAATLEEVDEAGLQEMLRRGAEAWKGVPDGAQWVRELRGTDEEDADLPEGAQESDDSVGSVTITHFRGSSAMENCELDYRGGLPAGTHKLYADMEVAPHSNGLVGYATIAQGGGWIPGGDFQFDYCGDLPEGTHQVYTTPRAVDQSRSDPTDCTGEPPVGAEKVGQDGFDAWWDAQVGANAGNSPGAEIRHWAKKAWTAATFPADGQVVDPVVDPDEYESELEGAWSEVWQYSNDFDNDLMSALIDLRDCMNRRPRPAVATPEAGGGAVGDALECAVLATAVSTGVPPTWQNGPIAHEDADGDTLFSGQFDGYKITEMPNGVVITKDRRVVYLTNRAPTDGQRGPVGRVWEGRDQNGYPDKGVHWTGDPPEGGALLYTRPVAVNAVDEAWLHELDALLVNAHVGRTDDQIIARARQMVTQALSPNNQGDTA